MNSILISSAIAVLLLIIIVLYNRLVALRQIINNLLKGVTCGRGICPFGSECCMTCDEEGQLIESGQCESTLYGNPGCPLINCLPKGKLFFL